MNQIKTLIYRYLTNADFFNLYKPPGAEEGGGGQTYVDFPTRSISVQRWKKFFRGVSAMRMGTRAKGPVWVFPIHSIGVDSPPRQLTVYQRRTASVCIAAQHIHGRNANRVLAWHPEHDFPEPRDPENRHQLPPGLVVYLVRTAGGEVWAGWYSAESDPVATDTTTKELLSEMLNATNQPGSSGIMEFAAGSLEMNGETRNSPFRAREGAHRRAIRERARKAAARRGAVRTRMQPTPHRRISHHKKRSEKEILRGLFDEDQTGKAKSKKKKAIREIRDRNTKAVRKLKQLYGYSCQITGETFGFKNREGVNYIEAHHLIPLGKGGDDDPRNIIIVNPLVHRMLHYADVSGIDLDNIEFVDDGSAILNITINGSPYTIRWHPKHGEQVQRTRS